MRRDAMPSPGQLSQGIEIQGVMCKAINSIEIVAGMTGGKASAAKQFDNFLVFCRTAIASFIETVVPTIVSRNIRNGEPNKLYIQASEELDPKFVPPNSAFTITGVGKVVTKVEVDGPYIILTVSVPWATGNVSTVAYVQPGVLSNLRDLSGNLLAAFAASAIVNAA